jgi:hypothetical protein
MGNLLTQLIEAEDAISAERRTNSRNSKKLGLHPFFGRRTNGIDDPAPSKISLSTSLVKVLNKSTFGDRIHFLSEVFAAVVSTCTPVLPISRTDIFAISPSP